MNNPGKLTIAKATAVAFTAAAWLALATPPALALPGDTDRLCAGQVPCSIQISSGNPGASTAETTGHIQEGISAKIVVTGLSNVTVEVQLFWVRFAPDGTFDHLEPYGKPIPVNIDTTGSATVKADLEIVDKPGSTEVPSTWIFVGLTDANAKDITHAVGTFVPFGSGKVEILGDGWGKEKPVGKPLDLRYFGARSDMSYAVDYLGPDGAWRNVTVHRADTDPSTRAAADQHDLSEITYQVPRGLDPRPYSFRLRSLNTGLPVATWDVIPSSAPLARPYLPVWTPPQTRHDTGLNQVSRDSNKVIMAAMATIGGGSILALAEIVFSGLKTRSRWGPT